jgi:hypothetical protein
LRKRLRFEIRQEWQSSRYAISFDEVHPGLSSFTMSFVGLAVALVGLTAGNALSRRALIAVGAPAAAWLGVARVAPAHADLLFGRGAPPIEEINANRAKIGLPPLQVIKADGAWAEHTGAFTEAFFDSTFKKRDDGFIYKFLNQPDGDKPQQGQKVSVYYTGYLMDGTKFDSAYDKKRPFEFRLGKQTVITGWEAVVGGMKLGQKVIVKIPPEFGYGDKDLGEIPPNSSLVFYIELVALGDKI